MEEEFTTPHPLVVWRVLSGKIRLVEACSMLVSYHKPSLEHVLVLRRVEAVFGELVD